MDELIASTPEPPYYAVVFTSLYSNDADEGYQQMAAKMLELAAQQPGYLSVETARGDDRLGITVSYWQDLDSIKAWKQVTAHLDAQRRGRESWYERYEVRIAKVEAAYGFDGS
jgi:heme-degrading monooxygenase HmoA